MMSIKKCVVYLTRLLIMVLSGLTLAIHVAQIVLLLQIEDTGSWWPNYIPYTFYYVEPVVSLISINILFFIGFRLKSIAVDRFISIINTILAIAIVIYNTLKSGTIPWLGNAATGFSSDIKGWVPYCHSYSYINTSLRCWFVNATWLGCVLIAFLWLLMTTYVFLLKDSDLYFQDDYENHDFKKDVPMVAAIVDSSTINKHPTSESQNELHSGF